MRSYLDVVHEDPLSLELLSLDQIGFALFLSFTSLLSHLLSYCLLYSPLTVIFLSLSPSVILPDHLVPSALLPPSSSFLPRHLSLNLSTIAPFPWIISPSPLFRSKILFNRPLRESHSHSLSHIHSFTFSHSFSGHWRFCVSPLNTHVSHVTRVQSTCRYHCVQVRKRKNLLLIQTMFLSPSVTWMIVTHVSNSSLIHPSPPPPLLSLSLMHSHLVFSFANILGPQMTVGFAGPGNRS